MNLPISRDVRVAKEAKGAEKDSASSPASSEPDKNAPESLSGLVTVMGFDSKDVLFRSDKVGTVQWRDSKGEVVALLVRIKPDIWGFSRRGEEDWSQVLERYGNQDIS